MVLPGYAVSNYEPGHTYIGIMECVVPKRQPFAYFDKESIIAASTESVGSLLSIGRAYWKLQQVPLLSVPLAAQR